MSCISAIAQHLLGPREYKGHADSTKITESVEKCALPLKSNTDPLPIIIPVHGVNPYFDINFQISNASNLSTFKYSAVS